MEVQHLYTMSLPLAIQLHTHLQRQA